MLSLLPFPLFPLLLFFLRPFFFFSDEIFAQLDIWQTIVYTPPRPRETAGCRYGQKRRVFFHCVYLYISLFLVSYTFLAGHGLVYRLPCFNAWDYEASDAMDTMILSVNITLLNVATTRCIASESIVLSLSRDFVDTSYS